ncbi:hypothetical protein KO500_08420 [Cellulophaga baltica]|uniref:hypothetical protein n=1 Tax=Cellulophaga TaxID=104264 RepID=UPI001C06E70B|nr:MULTISPECIES: hypothetical protein [Cellulophaga]MBU2996457.1 hypothetical protein [Cellulophaga baltica]MDO6767851.1 hypothetical protein [Cellulophaga sp. 1_MG-2023]
MNININAVPNELKTLIGTEEVDFIVKAKRRKPLSYSILLFVFSTFWLGISGTIGFLFLGPLFFGEEVHFKENGVAKVATLDNYDSLLMPAAILSFFMLIGIVILISAIVIFFQKGGYFVGTPSRLIQFRKGKATSTDWEQFNGTINTKSKGTSGNITFQLRTGKMRSRKNGPSQYVPSTISISGIDNLYSVEQKCRTRIKENDPTPANTSV